MRRVAITAQDDAWKVGMAQFAAIAVAKSKTQLHRGARDMLQEAKQRVHKDTRRLHDSGRLEERDIPDGLEVDVIFGGAEYGVDYAGYEETLHPYLSPSSDALSRTFAAVDDDLSMAWIGHAQAMDY